MRSSAFASCALVLFWSALGAAEAGFAMPPDQDRLPPPRYGEPPDSLPPPRYWQPPESALRLSIGPALRATSERADGGFGAALDIGAHAAGARLAGSWLRVGSDRGLSQYDAELWIDFGAEQRLHPILAAGAGVARLEHMEVNGLRASAMGIGTLRGTLEYELPIQEANARAGLDLEGALPAIRGRDAPEVSGWLLLMARVGVGF
ncbi:MAG TPA: hypothetical protein VGI10_19470 [Polyangiaceae bacterium]